MSIEYRPPPCPVVVLYCSARGSQGRPSMHEFIISGHASPVATLKEREGHSLELSETWEKDEIVLDLETLKLITFIRIS